MSTKDLQEKVNASFLTHFGRTPLRERLEDILREAMELNRFTDLANLKEEIGDILASAFQFCNESGWSVEDVIQETLSKIERRQLQYKSLGRKQKVAILGGAFDPPTIGHIKLAQFVLNTSRTFDSVWLMPCYQHMYNKSMVSPEHRLKMCKIAAEVDGRIHVSDYEINNQLRGETYHLVKRLLNEDFAKDQYDFSVIIGLDNANTFDKWVNYEELERMVRFVVVPRKGVVRDPTVTWYLNPPHIFLSPENDIPEISSTQVREALQLMENINSYGGFPQDEFQYNDAKRFIFKSVNYSVMEYINDHSLYAQKM